MIFSARASKGGVFAPHRKNTAESTTLIMPVPKKVTIPMSQHIGAPCTPQVKVGDTVKVGQLIGDSTAFVSAPIHSSVSGTVKAIKEITMPAGNTVEAIEIETDGLQEVYEGITPPEVHTAADLVQAVKSSGLVGLGGAGFPAHIKLNPPPGTKPDILIVNCAECEPYITSDYRECMENSWDIMSGVYAVKELLGIEKVIIAIEDNKKKAIRVLSDIADSKEDKDDSVVVCKLPSKYPQGAEKVLINAVTGRQVPAGKLPSDVGVLVMNVTSIAFLARYLKTGMPLVSKRMTIDGQAVTNPCNVIVPLGTSIKDIIEFCGGYKRTPAKILMGGPMMGIALYTDEMPVLKQNNAILALDESEAKAKEETACINCGKCISACPMSLTPCLLARAVKRKDAEELEKLNINTCVECGSCAFTCPAGKHLVQTMKMGKAILKNSKREVK